MGEADTLHWITGAVSVASVFFCLIVVVIALAILSGCGAIRMEGECRYTRTTEQTYECKEGGKVESIKTQPID